MLLQALWIQGFELSGSWLLRQGVLSDLPNGTQAPEKRQKWETVA